MRNICEEDTKITILTTIFLQFTKKAVLFKKKKSKKKIHCRSFQVDKQMTTSFATERHYIQSNNDKAKFTTLKAFTKSRPKDDLNALETKRSCLETTNTTSAINKISKNFRCEVRRSTVHDTAKLLTNNMKNGILSIDEKN